MQEHPHATLVRRGYDAFAANDMATIAEVFADDIAWHESGRNVLSGDYKGQTEVFGLFTKIAELTGGSFRLSLHDLLGSDDHVVALITASGTREGKTLNTNGVHVWHIDNGKATEFWSIPVDAYAEDEFWGA